MTAPTNALKTHERLELTRRVLAVCPTMSDLERLSYLARGGCHQLTGSELWAKAVSLVWWSDSQGDVGSLKASLAFCESVSSNQASKTPSP